VELGDIPLGGRAPARFAGLVTDTETHVKSADELAAARCGPGNQVIRVVEDIEGAATVVLRPGQRLVGDGTSIGFAAGQEGVRLVRDNEVRGLRIGVEPGLRALHNATTEADLGVLALRDLRVVGQVQILAQDATVAGRITVSAVDIEAADCLQRTEVSAYGLVGVRQGAFTLWNRQPLDSSVLDVSIDGLSMGRAGAPVRGAGVVISGAGDPTGRMDPQRPPVGRVRLSFLDVGEIHTDGHIEPGTADRIAGGVMVLYGVEAGSVRHHGTVTTYGTNDMVIDNWGDVHRWHCEALTSHGPSGVGVVNFGVIEELTVAGAITTYGTGARGLNVYLGHIGVADLRRIDTHGDAAIGVQVSRPVGRLVVRDGIHTRGGEGPSLVLGEIVQLSATALSVLEGGDIGELRLGGGLHSAQTGALQVSGRVGALTMI
jgi:hypothetical protein